MDRDRTVRRTVTRLLRVAKSTTSEHERSTAMARAHELMEKYGVSVTMDQLDEVRVSVKANSAFWRKRLLVVVAKKYACRVLQREDESAIVGEVADVLLAQQHFDAVLFQMLVAAGVSWKSAYVQSWADGRDYVSISELSDPELTVIGMALIAQSTTFASYLGVNMDQMPRKMRSLAQKSPSFARALIQRATELRKNDPDELKGLFQDSFLNAAVDEYARRLGGIKTPPPEAEKKSALDQAFEEEVERSRKRTGEAAKRAGRERVARVVQGGDSLGRSNWNFGWNPQPPKRLYAASSFLPPPPPPPEPSRFTFLELDDDFKPSPAVAPSPPKQETRRENLVDLLNEMTRVPPALDGWVDFVGEVTRGSSDRFPPAQPLGAGTFLTPEEIYELTRRR